MQALQQAPSSDDLGPLRFKMSVATVHKLCWVFKLSIWAFFMSFSFKDLSRERNVPLFSWTPISSEEAEEPSEWTGREVGCWSGLGHSSGIESELESLISDSTSDKCLLSPERTEGWQESD